MSVPESKVSFNELEREIFREVCKLGVHLLKTALESWDADLASGRERSIYRHKGKRRRTIKTILGEVEYERAVYEVVDMDGRKCSVYLLDEALGLSGSGFLSGVLMEQIVRTACESSYRETSRQISELTGQTVSHTAAWNVVQSIGKQLDRAEEQSAKRAKSGKATGTLAAKLLFEEQDGIYLKLQGKSRKKHGASAEMKLCIAYDGVKKAGKDRYELTNKVACASFESVRKFRRRKEGQISCVYNTDEVDMRVLGGDGANWIRQSVTDETVYFQLDQFHRNRAVLRLVSDLEARKIILNLLYSKKVDLLLTVIEAYANSVSDKNERENYLQLHSYFVNNKDGLIPYHRRGLTLPEPPNGKLYRRLGAMESNIFTIIGNRMKGRRACWSIKGGGNLARILCLKHTGRLSEALRNLDHFALPEKYAAEVQIKLSVTKVPMREGVGYNGFRKAASAPPKPEYKWLKGMGALQPLHTM